jgi:precorrin-8X/cobalt-precorrin-8 methylmutase
VKLITDPVEIERKSMELIEEELGELDCSLEARQIIKRVVHATAEPELADKVIISDKAIESGFKALKAGANIVTDVNMLRAGIGERRLSRLGGELKCFISSDEVASLAKEEGITRSMMSMRQAIKNDENQVFAIGNAPTALVELMRLVEADEVSPRLIVGTPVGFVGAKEAKAKLETLDVPYITLRGRRGGSAVAASIVNAMLRLIDNG